MMEKKTWKIILSALSIGFSFVSSAIGYGFMGGSDIDFAMKFICGFIFIVTPLLVTQLLVLTWRKDK